MTEKKCTRCGSVWTMAWAKKCVFCGGEGVELAAPEAVPAARPAPSAVERALEKTPNGKHVTATAPPPTRRIQEPPSPKQAGVPRVDPPTLSLLWGISIMTACAVLPAVVQAGGALALVGLLLAAAVGVAAPSAWLATQRLESVCLAAGAALPLQARLGKVLAIVGTFLIVFEIATFTVLLVARGLARA